MSNLDRIIGASNRVAWAARCYVAGDNDGLRRTAEASRRAAELEAQERGLLDVADDAAGDAYLSEARRGR